MHAPSRGEQAHAHDGRQGRVRLHVRAGIVQSAFMQRARILACLAIASACYTRPSLGDDTDTDVDGSGTMGSESTLTTSDTAPTTTTAMTSVTGDTSPPTTTASSDTEATTEPDSTGNTELGPQIVMSTPSDGDLAASLDPYFFIYFDRVVGVNDAVGKITVAQ